MERRTFLKASLSGGLLLAAPYIARASANELRIQTWEGYTEPEWLKPFEEKHNVVCRVAFTTSDDDLFTKALASKGADFDVFALNTSLVPRYVKAGLYQPLDRKKLPNYENLAPVFHDNPLTFVDGEVRSLPFAWGSNPLIYDQNYFKTPPESWGVLWDPKLNQQVMMVDDSISAISMTALYLGFEDPFNLNSDQYDAIKKKLIEQKKVLLTYYAGFADGVSLFAQNSVKAMYSMGEPQVKSLKDKGVNAALTIPKEKATGWLDGWMLSPGCRNVELAYAWFDACLAKDTGKSMTTKLGYGNTTDLAANQAAGLTYADKLVWYRMTDDLPLRTKLWNEVKNA
ncbi:ABC transporter substrate-binding protein [Mesorhizobium comanense]|uniref:ABC transporter substrate-binding protein n=1 Tax=Mesorhizobium comanense TaxID=2502215 RepID=UPI0010F57F95|nr:extracellular solute-binding protein [Mesorhizobium comanense]